MGRKLLTEERFRPAQHCGHLRCVKAQGLGGARRTTLHEPSRPGTVHVFLFPSDSPFKGDFMFTLGGKDGFSYCVPVEVTDQPSLIWCSPLRKGIRKACKHIFWGG